MKIVFILFSLIGFSIHIIASECSAEIIYEEGFKQNKDKEIIVLKFTLKNKNSKCVSALNIDVFFDDSEFLFQDVKCGLSSISSNKKCEGNLVKSNFYRVIIYGGIETIEDGESVLLEFLMKKDLKGKGKRFSCSASASDPMGNEVKVDSCKAGDFKMQKGGRK